MRVKRLQRVSDLGDESGEGANCLSISVLTTTQKQSWSHQNAQSFPDGSWLQREPIASRLSMETSHPSKALCISLAIRVTQLCIWRDMRKQT